MSLQMIVCLGCSFFPISDSWATVTEKKKIVSVNNFSKAAIIIIKETNSQEIQ